MSTKGHKWTPTQRRKFRLTMLSKRNGNVKTQSVAPKVIIHMGWLYERAERVRIVK